MIHEGWDRFYIPEPNSGCWIWMGAVHPNGYGMKGMYKAHKLFYEMQCGPVPEGQALCVCHSCDVPLCVNPDHLWLGTHLQNMQDKARKGRVRSTRGQFNPNAKLTPEQVREIRTSQESSHSLARRFQIDRHAIRKIKKGTAWAETP